MPFTPYHFGPSGFISLALRRWIDVPVFILANVIIDIEVLFTGHHSYCHTFLIGAAVGAAWGVAAYPFRSIFKWLMNMVCLPYKKSFWKMVISGILGMWLHVLVDGAYHYGVRMFWPNKVPLWRLINFKYMRFMRENTELICTIFLFATLIPYAFAVMSYIRENKLENQ